MNRTITTVELVNRTLSQWHSRNATGIPFYSNSIAALPNPTVLADPPRKALLLSFCVCTQVDGSKIWGGELWVYCGCVGEFLVSAVVQS